MKLNDFLDQNNISLSAFAAEIGTTAATVCRIGRGHVVPRRRLLERIHEATGGEVTPNDLVGLYCASPCSGADNLNDDDVAANRRIADADADRSTNNSDDQGDTI